MPLKGRRSSSLLVSDDVENDTAPIRCGFQAGSKPSLADSVGDRCHASSRFMPQTSWVCSRARASKGQLHNTKRVADAVWFVSVLSQDFANGGEKPFSAWSRAGI